MKTETRLLIADDWDDYALLDSGHLQKLERFGSQTVIRPDPQAFWEPARPVESWRADARFSTKSQEDDGAGNWDVLSPKALDSWPMQWNGLTFEARRTAFRHMGVFQEHSVHWRFAQEKIRAAGRPIKALNLFGYTGMMSLACAAAGAEVVHLDASPKSNNYGKDNQAMSGLQDRPIRWIADDAMKFTAREIRRGNTYDAIILDPPKFGRGPKNETWRFEENLPELLDVVKELLSDRPLFVILTAYAVRLSYLALSQALADRLSPLGGVMETGEMALPQQGADRLLPTAIYARWHAGA
ncbi:class I SAM-dependent methyltransferase [uncultured Hyphomonas sp.]|jgi:23S rRNA (cytosine1962-C5)-methyltransferase|uniref:class I SAM-dependent methyltransferase n=1 Tax=uncultured Hyphomonas sp. TaxID=225298 RepID=UPI000C4BCF65|nr:SAM-dependent methyltransferase [Hyphomonadaceae bacterium]MBA29848.1 SAM-dependent methyltransferase [Hyphomonadaceae bacterium]|tara:strand:+ start:7997 stop:8890 length:894 start_codon:yes stop_codon:yes gene_type:complete